MKRINLLPKPKQSELIYERLFHNISVALVLATCILLSGIGAQLITWAYLDRSQETLIRDIDRLKKATDKTESAQVKQEIRLVNSQMRDFEQLAAKQPQWSKILDAFAAHIPTGVKLSEFTADSTKMRIDIRGFSPTREQVIELYNNINNDKTNFKDIDYPLENVAKPVNVEFHFSFFIQEGVLVPKNE